MSSDPLTRRAFLVQALDGLPVRLRRSYLREAQAGVGFERFVTAFMTNPS